MFSAPNLQPTVTLDQGLKENINPIGSMYGIPYTGIPTFTDKKSTIQYTSPLDPMGTFDMFLIPNVDPQCRF